MVINCFVADNFVFDIGQYEVILCFRHRQGLYDVIIDLVSEIHFQFL